MLDAIDELYQDHLYAMDALRQSVSLRSYGQRDPLVEYKAEAYKLFESLMANIEDSICRNTFRISLGIQTAAAPSQKEDDAQKPEDDEKNPAPVIQMPPMPRRKMQFVTNDTSGLEDLMAAPGGAAKPKQGPVTVRREQPKIGRNEPCPCGSGKKYKNCCGRF
jgi:preprotein translocase subunit SecA